MSTVPKLIKFVRLFSASCEETAVCRRGHFSIALSARVRYRTQKAPHDQPSPAAQKAQHDNSMSKYYVNRRGGICSRSCNSRNHRESTMCPIDKAAVSLYNTQYAMFDIYCCFIWSRKDHPSERQQHKTNQNAGRLDAVQTNKSVCAAFYWFLTCRKGLCEKKQSCRDIIGAGGGHLKTNVQEKMK